MLSFRDNILLALTKLRTRRIRLGITLVVSGLLFSVLIAVSLVVRGTIASIENFTKEAFLNRFITSVSISTTDGQFNNPLQDEKYLKLAKSLFADQIIKMTAEAKRLGLSFDPTTVPKPYTEDHNGPDPNKTYQTLDVTQPAGQAALLKIGAPSDGSTEIKAVVTPYKPIGLYTVSPLSGYSGTGFSMTPIIKGKELADEAAANAGYSNGAPDPLKNFSQTTSVADDALMTPFQLKGTSFSAKAGDPVPVLAPSTAAAKLIGLADLPSKATNEQRLNRLIKLRDTAKNFEFQVCYRNSTATQQVADAVAQAAEIKSHAGDATYTMPSTIYAQNAQPCQPVSITRDTRTADQKAYDAKQTAFNQTFGTPAPEIKLMTFKIVGLLPDSSMSNGGATIEDFFSSMLAPNTSSGWGIPQSAVASSTVLSSLLNDPIAAVTTYRGTYVEFPDRQTQKRFLDEKGCSPSPSNNWCSSKGTIQTYPYGNPIASLYDGIKQAQTVLWWALGIIAGLSAIIMMGTIGKVIADSRKETSVFRALGARRLQIAQLYLLYAAALGAIDFVLALAIGSGLAMWLEATYSNPFSVAAVLAFNAADPHKVFHLIGWSWLDMGGIALLVLLTSQVATLLPLLTNIRRNPVKDMREE